MRKLRDFWMGFVIGAICITGCAGVAYKFYNVDMPADCYQNGSLIGNPNEDPTWTNLPLSTCQPDPANKMKCATLKYSDFTRLKTDLGKCQDALKECQKGNPPADVQPGS